MNRGYFGIAVYNPKTETNIGTLWRTANIFGAAFIATIGRRYRKQSSDTMKTPRTIPLFEYATFEDFQKNIPFDCELVGVELTPKSKELKDFSHLERAVYLLGAEDNGIPENILAKCHRVVRMAGESSMNVAVAGSIIIYHRQALNA